LHCYFLKSKVYAMNMKLEMKICGFICLSGKSKICILEDEGIGKRSLVMGVFRFFELSKDDNRCLISCVHVLDAWYV